MEHDLTYRICTTCVMDTSDPAIEFDADGRCNHCHQFKNVTSKGWHPDAKGKQMLDAIMERIRREGRHKEYDCVVGLSGGIDSSYLAVKLKEYELRPLVVHVDAGWNTELAVNNVERIVKYCGYELFTHVVNWEEVRDLQVAYMRAGVANQDVVQDHAFFANLYHFAVKNGIRYVMNGGNIATEGVFPQAWHHAAMDASNLHAIHDKFGTVKLRDYKTISFWEYYLYYPFVRRMTVIRPLDYLVYDKREALEYLKSEVGYKDYGRKHGESRFTRFFQEHYLPTKFGYDKRRPHLSSLILSGQMTRDEALSNLEQPMYDERDLRDDLAYVAKKLGITATELAALVDGQSRHYTEFSNWDYKYKAMHALKSWLESTLGTKVKSHT